MQRWVGRDVRWKVASFVLVVLFATLSLPLGVVDPVVPGVSGTTATGTAPHGSQSPAKQAQLRRIRSELHAVAVRRPWSERQSHLPAGAWTVLALVLLGLVLVSAADRPMWSPGLVPVQRGPPSSS